MHSGDGGLRAGAYSPWWSSGQTGQERSARDIVGLRRARCRAEEGGNEAFRGCVKLNWDMWSVFDGMVALKSNLRSTTFRA